MTFATMHYFGIGLHKISLGALVLALGLLVDDAIIVVEMMAIRMEQGFDRLKAASFAYETTAFPMLTGTLVTAAGFLPIATAKWHRHTRARSSRWSPSPSCCRGSPRSCSFLPRLLLPDPRGAPRSALGRGLAVLRARRAGSAASRRRPATGTILRDAVHRRFRALVVPACAGAGWSRATVFAFVLSIFGFRFVQQQFFTDSTRPELLVDLKLAEGASLDATEAQVRKLEAWLARRSELENHVSYVGTGSPRFYLPLDQQLPQASFAQVVLLTRGIDERERADLRWLLRRISLSFAPA